MPHGRGALDDPSRGDVLWQRRDLNCEHESERSEHLETVAASMRKAFSTPIVVEVEGREQLISSGAEQTIGYAPVSGEPLWHVQHGDFSMTSRPLAAHGMVFSNTGYMTTEVLAVRLGGQGDVTETHIE